MEKYETLGLVGEGSYGMVMKCRNKDNGRIVAIKKFLESEDDKMVKKIAMREIKLLKQLRHENLVNLLEVCKKKKRWYLVFEFVDHTLLDDLELFPHGLDYNRVRKYLFQIIKGIGFCHSHNIIHRDIKPENILVSQSGVVKLCDFGFARTLAAPGEAYTDYVATRWYRAPELLVGDTKYGKAVDVWAIGCLVTEMLTGEPLFPGDSDIDQLYHIMKCLGNLTPRHQELFYKNPLFAGVRLPEVKEVEPLERRYPKLSAAVLDLTKKCLQIDPDKRPSCADLLQCDFFNKDGFAERFAQELRLKIQKDARDHPLPKKSKISKKDKDDSLGEERKMLDIQDFNIDPKIKDAKLFKVKLSKAEVEKADRSSNMSCLYDSGTSQFKTVPPTSMKDSSSSLDYIKNPGMVIPPIIPNLATITPNISVNSGKGTIPGTHNYRVDEKTKKYLTPFIKQGKHSPAGHYNVSLGTSVSNEKNVLQANKKRWEFSKTDVRLPELNYNHLPELKGADARNSRFVKKENKTVSESRIPSLATIDLHNPSLALQQISGTSLPDASEASFPRVER
ncbi:cyclin-dependent kinase-like 2 isoform X1 [Chelonia mydas]|uniref:cyclin-dependent kinase-like 2 isoform X1 n=1 Tax=Chelonia mydas TaxID=8469 RepID=UPI000FFB9716|nr:cyclin-dependent kinase-like 2 isoform X1 [Chelonia mydas]XP_043400487.1 cyclin-dependent kinase-like 2 isoform X1 [Chelonia mydas]XP_043400488.1 cyclin-dependent kinase-like 2 isoform X1 [Chelonia mydas]XP_043400489.1 cyclin-dependent kinase-like 2 isoform X1 [Chelonia mydas]